MVMLLILLSLGCAGVLTWGFTGYNRCLRYSFLLSASIVGFAFPQLYGLFNSHKVPEEALEITTFMFLLVLICAVIGDEWAFRHPWRDIRRYSEYDPKKIQEAALALMCINGFVWLISIIFADEIARRTSDTGSSGAIVIVYFFGTVQRYGYALALLIFWKTRSKLAMSLAIFGAINYLSAILIHSRRGPAMEFVFITIITYALAKKRKIPAILLAVIFMGGSLWSTAIGHFRANQNADFFSKLETANFIEEFERVFENGGWEVRLGAETIAEISETGDYEYGKIHWNKLVHGYFPGQIFGHEIKEGLKFDIPDIGVRNATRYGVFGATSTGVADCYTSFGIFGCLKFMVIGIVMGRWYRRAVQGDLAGQLAYSTLMTAALHTISHGTYWLLNEWIHMAVFSYPLLYWAQKPRQKLIQIRMPRNRTIDNNDPWSQAAMAGMHNK